MNAMREVRLSKVTLNIGCGEAGEKLERAKKLLGILTGMKIVETKTKDRTTFGTPKGRVIGCKVTLRGKKAEQFLKDALEAVDRKVKKKSFDKEGNFAFGIKEHLDIPKMKYDPDIGIYGMDVCVTLERRGYRVERKRLSSKVGNKHIIKPSEAVEWITKNYGAVVE